MTPSPVRYAASPGGRIAYQTLGEGPLDLVVYPAGAWNIDMLWERPEIVRWLNNLARFARVIMSNARGSGGSDPLQAGITIEEWAQDFVYVLDAAESPRASVLVTRDIGPIGLLYAAAFPDRVSSLALVDGYARLTCAPDYPIGPSVDEMRRTNDRLVESWGSGQPTAVLAPALTSDPHLIEWYARFERATASPAVFTLIRRLLEQVDVRGVLPSVQAPTLVVAHLDDPYLPVEHGRYLAGHLPNATLVERPGPVGLPWLTDVEGTLHEVESFLTGTSSSPDLEDRFLATLMFTDIVDSTRRAAELGDAAWLRLLDEHDRRLSHCVAVHRGRQVTSTGDGVLATFDGPARAIRCAEAIRAVAEQLGLHVRIGLHTGEVENRTNDIGGIAVAIAARVMAEAAAGEILVSSAVPPLVAGSGITFDDRGVRQLKGVPGEWRVLAVV
jgi:class 3 adenylate cyclase/pimeloyl-ACP methyl ester carboxylesterase